MTAAFFDDLASACHVCMLLLIYRSLPRIRMDYTCFQALPSPQNKHPFILLPSLQYVPPHVSPVCHRPSSKTKFSHFMSCQSSPIQVRTIPNQPANQPISQSATQPSHRPSHSCILIPAFHILASPCPLTIPRSTCPSETKPTYRASPSLNPNLSFPRPRPLFPSLPFPSRRPTLHRSSYPPPPTTPPSTYLLTAAIKPTDTQAVPAHRDFFTALVLLADQETFRRPCHLG